MKLFYRELGHGRPIVILHGVFGSCDNWLTVSKGLAETHHVYLLDARNHGHSPKSDEFNYSAMANDLKEFLQEQSLEDAVLVGHSMGGKTVMKFASMYPSMLNKMVVVDISPRYYKRHHDSIIQGLQSIDLKNLKTRQEADQQLSAFEPDFGTRQFLLKNLYRDEQNDFHWRINLPVIADKIDNVGEALDENIRISKPTLFIRGSKSNYIREQDEDLIRKIFSDVRIETVEGAGHWVQAEKPAEFLEKVKAFL
ncbi:MAG: alpha/beta fold hydrolase [Cytophagaceae bacterium]